MKYLTAFLLNMQESEKWAKMNKYKNKKVTNKYGKFGSILEFEHYLALKNRRGVLGLKRQVRIKLGKSKDCKVHYIADFVYYDNFKKTLVVFDSKGYQTDVFKLKLKWLLDSYSGFEFHLAYENKIEIFKPYSENNPELEV